MDFTGRKCVPCHAGTPRIDAARARELAASLRGWQTDGAKLERRFQFKDFAAAMRFVNAMAEVAERENHHPDFLVHGWNKVDVTLSTHAIGGLSENDFIMASHIDGIPAGQG
jgi:4a-hydroxytetrahydrobiopterin dehydratase